MRGPGRPECRFLQEHKKCEGQDGLNAAFCRSTKKAASELAEAAFF